LPAGRAVAEAVPGKEATKRPPPLLLYSTNTYLKFRIQQDYRAEHFVWCSPVFAAEALNKYALGAGLPPSSDPASIYRDLHHAVQRTDEHNDKIIKQKAVLMALAVDWCNDGHISPEDRDDITAVVNRAPFAEWRPIILVIPFAGVASRVRRASRDDRAGSEPEYIVPDLKEGEFGIVEPKI
jgi:hypothetical protein